MKTAHRLLLLVLAAPLALAAVLIGAYSVNAVSAEYTMQRFYAIEPNTPRESVVRSLGQPDRIRECGKHLWWGNDANYRGENLGQCVTEERYEYFLTAFGVGYTSSGLVISKYHYVSE
jgi:hypothetical protein